MPHFTVYYGLTQRFPFSAHEAYEWSTDYSPDDIVLSGRQGTRQIERVDAATLILTDTVTQGHKKAETKVRLVRFFPDLLMWTNTRLSEEGKHSQFIYKVLPNGPDASHLEFSGAQVDEAATRPSKAELARRAKEYTEADALIWVHLAEAMEKDLAPRRSHGKSTKARAQ